MPYIEVTEIVCRLAAKYRHIKRDPIDAVKLGEAIVRIPTITFLPSQQIDCSQAAALGARHHLRGVDAIIAQAALENHCRLITDDDDFKRSTVSEIVQIVGL